LDHPGVFFLFILIAAVVLDIFLMRIFVSNNRNRKMTSQDIIVFGRYSPTITWIKNSIKSIHVHVSNRSGEPLNSQSKIIVLKESLASKTHWLTFLEVIGIILFGLLMGSPFLNLDPVMFPAGVEYPDFIQTNYLWERAIQCGPCAFWNGTTRGGAPAFVDPHTSTYYPLVIIFTLIWGVRNGAKLVLVAAFIMAGLAQWWLGWRLGVRRIPRLWAALMAITGGYLAGRMEAGEFSILLSTAACTLVFPALIWFFQDYSRRAAVVLGIVLALVILAGQGYLQIGLLWTAPALLFLLPWDNLHQKPVMKHLILSLSIALLLASFFLVPFLHFLPNFTKDMDITFNAAQELQYVPLTLVIRDRDFYMSQQLTTIPVVYLYTNYIGWVAIILAIIALIANRSDSEKRLVRYLVAVIFLVFLGSSREPYTWLFSISSGWLNEMLAGIRHPPVVMGLAIPPLLGLAAIGLDYLLDLKWPKIQMDFYNPKSVLSNFSLDLRWLLLIPLVFSLKNTYTFSKQFLYMVQEDPMVEKINQGIQTADLQWVNPPFGVHAYLESATRKGLKMAYGWRVWNWKNRENPEPKLEAILGTLGAPPKMTEDFYSVEDAKVYLAPPDRAYAKVIYNQNGGSTICQANGTGGDIDVKCNAAQEGRLEVTENNWTGWTARLDGKHVRIENGSHLAVAMPAGEHTVEFRYRPWDVPLGILLSMFGIGLAVYIWSKHEIQEFETSPEEIPHSISESENE
jgi:hypothetical protein